MDPLTLSAAFDTAAFCAIIIVAGIGCVIVGFCLGVSYAMDRAKRGR